VAAGKTSDEIFGGYRTLRKCESNAVIIRKSELASDFQKVTQNDNFEGQKSVTLTEKGGLQKDSGVCACRSHSGKVVFDGQSV
jgi:hypothetical protein